MRNRLGFLPLLALGACSGVPVIEHPSPNRDDRIRFLVMHFTDEPFARSLEILTDATSERRVSAHYLVSGPGDPAAEPRVYRLVPEAGRAWHAGDSHWQKRQALNDQSIGIEIVYESHCPRPGDGAPGTPAAEPPRAEEPACRYEEYPEAQVALVTALAREILARHPDIDPTRVVGHSDIAPSRKPDPGPRFPWLALHRAGVGAWWDAAEVARQRALLAGHEPRFVALLQAALASYGYLVAETGELDPATRDVLYAFQTHFLPAHRSGSADVDTVATALALVSRYQPKAHAELAQRFGISGAE